MSRQPLCNISGYRVLAYLISRTLNTKKVFCFSDKISQNKILSTNPQQQPQFVPKFRDRTSGFKMSTDLDGPIVQVAPNQSEQTESIGGELPAHLSHDPQYNMKRSDPFQFGSRFLKEEDNVFEFNAWDHVETDDTYIEYSEIQYSKQREAPVSDFDKS